MITNRPKPFTIVQGICNDCGHPYAHVTSGDVCSCYEDELEQRVEELEEALEESIKLQSHYAGLLNNYDDGKRIKFKDADEWIKRLKVIGGDENA